MKNFKFQNPTKLIFGRGTIANLATEIPIDKKIMLTFGGGSVRTNGVYDQVIKALEKHHFIEFWGIEPNPKVETLRKAVALGKEHKVDFIVAVGGGSVLDGTKLIASAIPCDDDAWDLVLNPKLLKSVLPFASVMTLPATGSEMNTGAVISNLSTKEKFSFYSRFPQFSILDPETTYSLPAYQIANGIADTFVHVIEQYLTVTNESILMDRWAEGILLTLKEIAPKIEQNHTDYDLMSNYMLSATMALNGFIAMGVSGDWTTHMIGHELTALHGVTHGESLAIVLPRTMEVLRKQKKEKILQYGERVWNISEGTEEARIDKTIAQTETFFRSLGLKTRLHELNIGEETISEIEERLKQRGIAFGEKRNVTPNMVRKILENSL